MPIGHAINPNVAMVTGFSCHRDQAEALRRGDEGFRFFGYALGHHYIFGDHQPGITDIWSRFENTPPQRKQRVPELTASNAPVVNGWGRRIVAEPEVLQKNMEQILRKATGIAEPKS